MTDDVSKKTLAVAIVEDRTEIRRGVALLIDSATGFRCSGSYADMEAALAGFSQGLPDVVLVDLVLPGMSGIEGIRRLRASYPHLALLIFTVYEDDERVFDALCAGALGCISKKTAPARLLEIVRIVASGGAAPMSPEAAGQVLELLMTAGRVRLPQDERRLLELLSGGDNRETAAAALDTSPAEVDRLARSCFRRLHELARGPALGVETGDGTGDSPPIKSV